MTNDAQTSDPDPFEVEVPYEASSDFPRWGAIFEREQPIRVEIGIGKSEFLIEVALRDPQYNYLGFEYSRKRVRKFLKKVRNRAVTNIRVVRQNITDGLDSLFEPQSLDHVYILFPDPWPKRRHAKHRFVQAKNVEPLVRFLRPGGGISLRTDDPAYARQMLAVLESQSELENRTGPDCFADSPEDPFTTLYQVKWQKEGRRIYYLEYVKRGKSGTA